MNEKEIDNLVYALAIEMRKNRFKRTGRGSIFDPETPLNENELDDARVAVEFLSDLFAM